MVRSEYDDRPNDDEDGAAELREGNGVNRQVEQAELIEEDGGEHLSGDDEPYRGRRPDTRAQNDGGGNVERSEKASRTRPSRRTGEIGEGRPRFLRQEHGHEQRHRSDEERDGGRAYRAVDRPSQLRVYANCTGTAIPAIRATNTKAHCALIILVPVVAVARTPYP